LSAAVRSGVVHDRKGLSARLNAWRKRSLFSPYYLDWLHLQRSVETLAGEARGIMLDVGTSEGPYRAVFAGRIARYVGLEYPPSILEKRPDLWQILDRAKASVDVFGDGNRLPFGTGTVDTVLSTEVLEHLPDPARCVRELQRVLKPGGRLLLTAPFLQPLHELPSDYFRFTPGGLRALVEGAGLVVERIEPRGSFPIACGALLTQFLLRSLGARERQADGSVLPSAWRNLLLAPVYAAIQATALATARVSSDPAVALGYSLVARKP
jgi:SAM-dependent methyltransferase